MININAGRNEEIVNRCRRLAGYSSFIAKIRSLWKELGDLEEAVKEAITYCSNHDILKEHLQIYGSEVLNMILTEWNTEDAIAYARKEGHEEGRSDEKLEIAQDALAKGYTIEVVQDITGLDIEVINKLRT